MKKRKCLDAHAAKALAWYRWRSHVHTAKADGARIVNGVMKTDFMPSVIRAGELEIRTRDPQHVGRMRY